MSDTIIVQSQHLIQKIKKKKNVGHPETFPTKNLPVIFIKTIGHRNKQFHSIV